MNEEIKFLEKTIKQLERRVTVTARESFTLNGEMVYLIFDQGLSTIGVYVGLRYVGSVKREHPARAETLASIVAEACDACEAATVSLLIYRFKRAEI